MTLPLRQDSNSRSSATHLPSKMPLSITPVLKVRPAFTPLPVTHQSACVNAQRPRSSGCACICPRLPAAYRTEYIRIHDPRIALFKSMALRRTCCCSFMVISILLNSRPAMTSLTETVSSVKGATATSFMVNRFPFTTNAFHWPSFVLSYGSNEAPIKQAGLFSMLNNLLLGNELISCSFHFTSLSKSLICTAVSEILVVAWHSEVHPQPGNVQFRVSARVRARTVQPAPGKQKNRRVPIYSYAERFFLAQVVTVCNSALVALNVIKNPEKHIPSVHGLPGSIHRTTRILHEISAGQ